MMTFTFKLNQKSYLILAVLFVFFCSVLTNIWLARDSRLQTLGRSRDSCMISGFASTTETGVEGEFSVRGGSCC